MAYLMDSPTEGHRVEIKTDVDLTVKQLLWAGVGPSKSFLDLGCAAGTTSRLAAGLVGPSGTVVGIDSSQLRIDQASSYPESTCSIAYRCGLAESIPAADGEFDVSWSRFLFEYLASPRTALNELIRVTKPGGTVCVADIDGNCVWHSRGKENFRAEIDAAIECLAGLFDPRVGLSLYSYFVETDLTNIQVDIRPYHLIAGAISDTAREHWALKLDGVATALVKKGWQPARANALRNMFLQHLDDPKTFTYSVVISVRGDKPLT
jgi:ubiquinone/menaquinone biosynthesis C-methylase UbiE